ncbi:CGNR zinc finger domain-containing protein [Aestuariivirga sp.]|uniref:CGNR zinc finger domain-containing protein n=1 Tax=Aestuariivirga sp. TaxID=2650926 RepID=UPI00359375C8
MRFSWNQHRFSGGLLALDVANSVIMRHDNDRRRDRFGDAATFEGFVDGANRHCGERLRFGALAALRGPARTQFIALRESIDFHFRGIVTGAATQASLSRLLADCAALLGDASASALETETALSALRLAAEPPVDRLRICGHCGWLFIDRSKNRSRMWCDMAVCGNREKARRHYRRVKSGEEVLP